jgi:hypothetical protein
MSWILNPIRNRPRLPPWFHFPAPERPQSLQGHGRAIDFPPIAAGHQGRLRGVSSRRGIRADIEAPTPSPARHEKPSCCFSVKKLSLFATELHSFPPPDNLEPTIGPAHKTEAELLDLAQNQGPLGKKRQSRKTFRPRLVRRTIYPRW